MRIKLKSLITSCLLLFCMVFFTQCKKATLNFGQEFLGQGLTDIIKVDSFSSSLSTVYMDSIITSNKGIVMVGGYTDPIFGRIDTKSYMLFSPPSWTNTTQPIFFDSICLLIKTNGSFYGDTTMPINITVRELSDSVVFDEGKFVFFNNKSFATKSSFLASLNTIITPQSNQTISLRLPNSLGDTLFRRLRDPNDNVLKNLNNFLNYFRGIQISSNSNSQLIANFSDDVVMRIYYRQDGGTLREKSIDFNITNRNKQFNQILIDRTGTQIASISSNNREIPAVQTNNLAFLQSATNSAIKLSFAGIRNIRKMPNFAKLLKAALIVKPLKTAYDRKFYLPPFLKLSETDVNNKSLADLFFINNNGGFSTQTGLLQIDYVRGENTQYSYDVTNYVRTLLQTNTGVSGEGLLLVPPSPNAESQFARVVLPNNQAVPGSIRLEIFYASVK
jgi:hypothetical protein